MTVIHTDQPPVNLFDVTRRETVTFLQELDKPTNTALYIAMDRSLSMRWGGLEDGTTNLWNSSRKRESRYWVALEALVVYFTNLSYEFQADPMDEDFVDMDGEPFLFEDGDQVALEGFKIEQLNDIYLALWSDEINFRTARYGCTPLMLAELAAWVRVFQRNDNLRFGTDFGNAFLEVEDFLDKASDGREKVVMFFTDGQAVPSESADVAVDIRDSIPGLQVYGYSIVIPVTDELEKLDNTPQDGVPQITSLNSSSWGVWDSIYSPPEWNVTPRNDPRGEYINPTTALLQNVVVNNNSETESIEVGARILEPTDVGATVSTIVRSVELGPGESTNLGIDRMIVMSGEIFQVGVLQGSSAIVHTPYVLNTTELFETLPETAGGTGVP